MPTLFETLVSDRICALLGASWLQPSSGEVVQILEELHGKAKEPLRFSGKGFPETGRYCDKVAQTPCLLARWIPT